MFNLEYVPENLLCSHFVIFLVVEDSSEKRALSKILVFVEQWLPLQTFP